MIRITATLAAIVSLAVIVAQTPAASIAAGAPFWSPAWSPDGRQIAFISDLDDATHPDLYVMDAEASTLRRLTKGPTDCPSFPCYRRGPTWSPDGMQIAYNAQDWIDVINVDGTGHRRLWDGGNRGIAADSPFWSPGAGRRIVFSVQGESKRSELWMMNADGTAKRPLARPPQGFAYSSPTWSPAGRWIAFSLIREPHPTELRRRNLNARDHSLGRERPDSEDQSWIISVDSGMVASRTKHRLRRRHEPDQGPEPRNAQGCSPAARPTAVVGTE